MKYHIPVLFILALFIAQNAFAQQQPQNALDSGDLNQARSMLLEMTAAESNDETVVAGLCGLAQLKIADAAFHEAEEILTRAYDRSLNLKKSSGWHVVIAWLRADIAHRQGKTDVCELHLANMRSNLKDAAKTSPAWQGALEYLTSIIEEDNSKARDAAQASIDAYNNTRYKFERGMAYLRLADLEWDRDKQRRAFRLYDSAIHDFRADASEKAMQMIAQTQLVIAKKKLETDDPRGAVSRLTIAKKEIETIGNPDDLLKQLKELEDSLQSRE